MTLNLAMTVTLDPDGVRQGAAVANSELQQMAKRAQATETSFQNLVNAQMGIGRAGNANRGADIQAYGRKLDELRAKYNPVFAAQRQYETEQQDIIRANRLGAISQDEMTAALDRAKLAYTAQASAARIGGVATANAGKLAAHEVTNLSYQMNDIAVMLASGQSPFVMMMQQGTQVSQIMGKRGLGEILPALLTGITSLINPTTLLLAGITAVGYGGYAAFNSIRGEVKSTEDVLDAHEANIRRLKDAYSDAADGASQYARDTIRTLDFLNERSVKDLRAQLEAQLSGIADANSYNKINERTGASYTQVPGSEAFTDVFRRMREEAQKAQPDVRGLRDEIAKIGNEGTEDVRKFADALIKSLDPSLEIAEGLSQSSDAMTKLRGDAEAFVDALKQLDEGDRATLGPREIALEKYNEALEKAIHLGDALEARQAYLDRLERIEFQENPISQIRPAERPLDLDREPEKRSAGVNYIANQEQQLERLRVEIALIGASAAERERAIAKLEIENELRREGIDVTSDQAEAMRRNSQAIADQRIALERLSDAYGTAQNAGRSMIDGLTDKLTSGDLEGALKKMADGILSTFNELAIKNPLKNALYGDNLGTLDDIGGIGGLFNTLLGRGRPQDGSVTSSIASSLTGSMNVSAATVIVNGAVSFGGGSAGQDAISRLLNPANNNGGPAARSSGNSVRDQVWNYFADKGLASHQIAGIVGNVAAESAFNPLAVGDGGHAFGLFQHNDRRHKLFDFIGGKGNLSNIQGQLDFAWHELQTTERNAFSRLRNATNVKDATAAFGGFERPFGYDATNPEAMHGWSRRLSEAESAMEKFGSTTSKSTAGLATLSNGFEGLGSGFQNLAQKLANTSAGSGGGSLLQSLFGGLNGLANAWNVSPIATMHIAGGGGGLFDKGGHTGNGADDDIAGFAHRNEFVFSAAATRNLGVGFLQNLHERAKRGTSTSAMPGYQRGGYVNGFKPGSAETTDGGFSGITINNNGTAQTAAAREESDGRGGRRLVLQLEDAVGDALVRPGSAARRRMGQTYGLKPRVTRR